MPGHSASATPTDCTTLIAKVHVIQRRQRCCSLWLESDEAWSTQKKMAMMGILLVLHDADHLASASLQHLCLCRLWSWRQQKLSNRRKLPWRLLWQGSVHACWHKPSTCGPTSLHTSWWRVQSSRQYRLPGCTRLCHALCCPSGEVFSATCQNYVTSPCWSMQQQFFEATCLMGMHAIVNTPRGVLGLQQYAGVSILLPNSAEQTVISASNRITATGIRMISANVARSHCRCAQLHDGVLPGTTIIQDQP